jgi:hypothetical protein
LLDTDTSKITPAHFPISNQIYVDEFPKQLFVEMASSLLRLDAKGLKTYIVSSNPKITGDASFEEICAKLQDFPNFLWVGDKNTVPVSSTDFYKEFYLEQNPQVVENIWQNRHLFGARIPLNEYEESLEMASLSSKIKAALKEGYDSVFKNSEKIIVSGSPGIFFSDATKLILPMLNAINYPGIWEISFDKNGFLDGLATINYFEKDLYPKACEVNKIDVGVTIAVIPNARNITVSFENGGVQEFDLGLGDPFLIPLNREDKATLTVGGRKGFSQEFFGASLGVCVDPRPRPVAIGLSKFQSLKEFERLTKIISSKI